MIDNIQIPPTEAEIAEVMFASKGYHADIIRRLAFERDRLQTVLQDFYDWHTADGGTHHHEYVRVLERVEEALDAEATP